MRIELMPGISIDTEEQKQKGLPSRQEVRREAFQAAFAELPKGPKLSRKKRREIAKTLSRHKG